MASIVEGVFCRARLRGERAVNVRGSRCRARLAVVRWLLGSSGIWSGLLALMTGCGSSPQGTDAGVFDAPPARIAHLEPAVAFEGQSRFVTELYVDEGDLSGASFSFDPPDVLELREHRCVGSRCGLWLSVRDTTPNQGRPLPAPIDAKPVRILVDNGDGGPPWQALLSVQPLDALRNTSTSGGPVAVSAPTILAASAESNEGAVWKPSHDGPARWFVFGSAVLAGTLDLRGGNGSSAAPGGGAGGEEETTAPTPGGGAGGAGGGGGGHAEAGTPGSGPGGVGMGATGGPAWGEPSLPCLTDPREERCGGGGGGGGAEGPGGGGGGGLLLVVLGTLDLTNGRILADGAEGRGGGGGGAGGAVHLAAWDLLGAADVSVRGGAGSDASSGATGGAGARGRLRMDLPPGVAVPDAAWLGPTVDPREVPPILESEELVLRGRVAPGVARVQAGVAGSEMPMAEAPVDASGAFELRLRLPLGSSRLWLRTDAGARSWVGNSLELQTIEPGRAPVPVGALLNVVRVR